MNINLTWNGTTINNCFFGLNSTGDILIPDNLTFISLSPVLYLKKFLNI